MTDVLDYAPIAATTLAIPQFLPQIVRLRATEDAAGLSWAWALLTSLNNAAWIAYFALARYWSALVPATAATLLAGLLALMLTRRGQAEPRSVGLITGWAALLAAAGALFGRAGLGTLLTAAFAVQVAPSIWTAYRTARPTGVSRATWLLILGELGCWLAYGVHESDPRLTVLGALGVTASLLMLARICQPRPRAAAARARQAPVQLRGSLTLAKPRTSGNGGWSPGFRSTWNVLSSIASMEKLPRQPMMSTRPASAHPSIVCRLFVPFNIACWGCGAER